MGSRVVGFLVVLALGWLLGPRVARADDLAVLAADFAVRGGTGDYVKGMNEVVVSLQNGSERRRQGVVLLDTMTAMRPGVPAAKASASFDLAAGADVTLRVPVYALDATVLTIEEDGVERFTQEFRSSPEQALRLYDAHDVPRLRASLENVPMNKTAASPGPYSSVAPAPASGGLRVRVIPAMYPRGAVMDSGRVLPTRVASWHGIHAVFMPTSRLVALSPEEFTALQGFVLSGGTLALSVSRPDDLESPRVIALTGGTARETPPSAELTRSFPRPFDPTPEFARYDKIAAARDEVSLHGWEGGNLRASLFGASATFGLGEVTLLSVDLDNPLHADDPWVAMRLAELARQSYERRQQGTAALGSGPGGASMPGTMGGADDTITLLLEGRHSTRWIVVAISLLLCAYGALVGPVLFGMGKKRGDLLFPLRWLPVISLGAFAIIVLFGAIGKGGSKSNRLLYVETGAGMSVGAGVRYRGFFTPSSDEIDVGCSARQNHLAAPFADGRSPSLVVDAEQLRVGQFESQPSETVVVREDGLFDVGGAVSITRSSGGVLTVKNATPHELVEVLLKTDTEEWFIERSVPAGGSFDTSAGPTQNRNLEDWLRRGPPTRPRPFEDYSFRAIFQRPAGDEESSVGDILRAIDYANPDSKRWFPAGTPVLLARVVERDGAKRDSGVRVGTSQFILRVVGFGGAP